jgi:hypothetical protein
MAKRTYKILFIKTEVIETIVEIIKEIIIETTAGTTIKKVIGLETEKVYSR